MNNYYNFQFSYNFILYNIIFIFLIYYVDNINTSCFSLIFSNCLRAPYISRLLVVLKKRKKITRSRLSRYVNYARTWHRQGRVSKGGNKKIAAPTR